MHTARQHDRRLSILERVDAVNEDQKGLLARRIVEQFGPSLEGRRIALWGLAFKPGTDDLREAPSLVLIDELRRRGAEVVAYDPVAMDATRDRYPADPGLSFVAKALDACEDADALVIITEWKEFRSPDFEALRLRLRQPIVFDGRNLYDPELIMAEGIDYRPIGRCVPPTRENIAPRPSSDRGA
jgi:UDPglucose 6-dehydrogenase